jgi:hypothetical protein
MRIDDDGEQMALLAVFLCSLRAPQQLLLLQSTLWYVPVHQLLAAALSGALCCSGVRRKFPS